MRVFLSWSGETSRRAAIALRDWLPLVVQAVDPYMSSEDIEKGARWNSEIAGELETCNFGIICLTPENIEAPWIHFEAGALSKSIESARVSPILLGLKPADVTGPLVQFQFTLPHRDDLLRLVTAINSGCNEGSLERERLERVFNAMWPLLEGELQAIVETAERGTADIPRRGVPDMLEELLELTRNQTRLLSQLGTRSPASERMKDMQLALAYRGIRGQRRRRLLAVEVLGLPALTQFLTEANDELVIGLLPNVSIDEDRLHELQSLPEFQDLTIRTLRVPVSFNNVDAAMQQDRLDRDT